MAAPRTLTSLSAFLVALSACEQDDGDATKMSPLDRVIAASCSFLFRCEENLGPLYASEAACRRDITELYKDEVAVGTEEELNACADSISLRSCDDQYWGSEHCERGLYGSAASAGESCEERACGPGLYCHASSDSALCRVCVAWPGVGAECGSDPPLCSPALYCDGSTHVCTDRKPDGAPCGNRSECWSLHCDNGLCQAGVPLGGECESDGECAEVYRICRDGICSDRVPVGGNCLEEDECLIGLLCSDHVCKEDSAAALGQPCLNTCVQGAYCDHNAKPVPVCRLQRRLGELCLQWDMCAPPMYCNMDLMECVPLQADGGECRLEWECASGFCRWDYESPSGQCAQPGVCIMP